MTTVDLLQHYLLHEHSNHDCKTSHESRASNSKSDHSSQDHCSPDPDPPHYFDAKTKALHDMLDGAVKDLANSQAESTSEYEGTLWRSPLQPRSGSPAYSEISDSFESPAMIEHCTNDLLSTPMSPTSGHLKGPDGWPLGVEVAINDFRRGKLSTVVLEESELPNTLILRKPSQSTPRFRDICVQNGQETVGCENGSSEQRSDKHHKPETVDLQTLVSPTQRSSVQFQQYGEKQDLTESASLQPLAFRQQSSTRRRQSSDCRDGHASKVQETSDGEHGSDVSRTSTLSTAESGTCNSSRETASTDFNSVLANDDDPFGLPLANAGLEPLAFQGHNAEHHVITCLLHKHTCQTTLRHTLEAPDNAQQEKSPIHAVTNMFDKPTRSSESSHVLGIVRVDSIDCEIGDTQTIQDSRNNSLQPTRPLTFEDDKTTSESDVVFQKTYALLEGILEESEDALTSPSTLDPDPPQHFSLKSDKVLGLPETDEAGKKRDSMFAFQLPLAEPSTTSLSPPRAPPPLKLTIKSSNKLLAKSTEPSRQHPIDVNSSESNPPAATMAELRNLARQEGYLYEATLVRLRKAAETQPHFRIGPDSPEDQPQAAIHPLLRSRSFPRPEIQASQVGTDAARKYIFKDIDGERHEVEGVTSAGQRTQRTESLINYSCREQDTFSESGQVMEDITPGCFCAEDQMEDQEAEIAGPPSIPPRSTLRSSNESTLTSSREDTAISSSTPSPTWPLVVNHSLTSPAGSPDTMPSPISHYSISSSTTGYYPDSGPRSPTIYNSWASDPRPRERGNSCSTPTSGATVPTSPAPTPNTAYYTNTPASHEVNMTPSSSFGNSTGYPLSPCAVPMTPSSSFGEISANKADRRSISFPSMFARYHKGRFPEPLSPAMTDSLISSKQSAESGQDGQITNDPFTSTRDSATQFSLNLRAPHIENQTDPQAIGVDKLDTPTKRTSGRFGLRRRSLSVSGRPSTEERLECALSTLVFNPNRSLPRKRKSSTATSADGAAKSGGSGFGNRRSLCISTKAAGQEWNVVPSPTSTQLRDELSMLYRAEPLEANGHYLSRKDALQGMKDGLKKVFGR